MGSGADFSAADPDADRVAPGGLDGLFREHYEPMVRLAFLLTRDVEVARDLVQDSFVRVHSHWSSIEQPVPYLRVTVVNACRAHHRARRRERRRHLRLVSVSVAPESIVLFDALGALPARQQAALVLRYYDDCSDAEIAQLLDCRVATVRSLIHRGLQRLGVTPPASQTAILVYRCPAPKTAVSR